MKAQIFVSPKEGILDPQGLAVMNALKNLGFSEVSDVRIGKYIQIELKEGIDNRERVRKMCEELLHNPLIESYKFELLEDA
jgi:phosphoribosylformylglycinamidine synthase